MVAKNTRTPTPQQLEPGSLIYIRYLDSVLFRDADPTKYFPWTRECVGWLDRQDDEQVRIVWERVVMPDPPDEARQRAIGLSIVKRTILEIRRV